MSKTRKDKLHREYDKVFTDGGIRKGPLRGIQAQGMNTGRSMTGKAITHNWMDEYYSFKDAVKDK
jgi:hypothetical protein